MLGLVDAVIRHCGIFVPHSILSWLFEERQKLGFHQPSRTKAAHALTRAIALLGPGTFSFALWGKVGMGAGGVRARQTYSVLLTAISTTGALLGSPSSSLA